MSSSKTTKKDTIIQIVYYILINVLEKRKKEFERITWDEALETITSKWRSLINEYGPESIIPYSYLGNQGLVHGLNGGDSFFNALGATVCERTFAGKVHVQLG